MQLLLQIPAIFVCPTELITPTELIKYDLPKAPEGSKFNYPNSEGLSYEAQEVRNCIKQGTPLITASNVLS